MNQEENKETPPGLAPRVAVSIIVFFGLLIFAIIYVVFFASSFSFFQQIVIISGCSTRGDCNSRSDVGFLGHQIWQRVERERL